MGVHVDYDTDKRIIYVTTAPTLTDGDWVVDLDIKTDVYSDGKEDWLANDSLNKFYFPVRSVGGDDLPGEKSLGATFFLDSGWKLKPYEADHVFQVNGNFYSEDGTSPFISTSGIYNIMVINTVSSLVDSIVQQLAEIEYASFGGGVHIDVSSSYAGTNYPVGTPQAPVNNLADAKLIATERGFNTIHLIGDIEFTNGDVVDAYDIYGEGHSLSSLTFSGDVSADDTIIRNSTVKGALDGNDMHFYNCHVEDLDGLSGMLIDCQLMGDIVLTGPEDVQFINCVSAVPGTGTPVVDMGGSGRGLGVRAYAGGLKLINLSGNENISVDFVSGQLKLDSTISAGTIVVRGAGIITEEFSTGTATVVDSGLTNPEHVADHVWAHADGILTASGVETIRKIEVGRWKIESNQMIFYEADNTTEIMRFDLFDEAGDPANTDIFDRQRV